LYTAYNSAALLNVLVENSSVWMALGGVFYCALKHFCAVFLATPKYKNKQGDWPDVCSAQPMVTI
jgi:hypothetical protein